MMGIWETEDEDETNMTNGKRTIDKLNRHFTVTDREYEDDERMIEINTMETIEHDLIETMNEWINSDGFFKSPIKTREITL